jgi:hypothetical protein
MPPRDSEGRGRWHRRRGACSPRSRAERGKEERRQQSVVNDRVGKSCSSSGPGSNTVGVNPMFSAGKWYFLFQFLRFCVPASWFLGWCRNTDIEQVGGMALGGVLAVCNSDFLSKYQNFTFFFGSSLMLGTFFSTRSLMSALILLVEIESSRFLNLLSNLNLWLSLSTST